MIMFPILFAASVFLLVMSLIIGVGLLSKDITSKPYKKLDPKSYSWQSIVYSLGSGNKTQTMRYRIPNMAYKRDQFWKNVAMITILIVLALVILIAYSIRVNALGY